MGHIFLHLCMPGNFLLNPRHRRFYVLGCKLLFLKKKNVLGLWSGTQLSNLEAIFSFWVLLLGFVGRVQGNLYRIGTLLRQYLVRTLPNAPCISRIRIFHSGWRECELISALCEVQWLFHLLIPVILSLSSDSFFVLYMQISTSQRLKETALQIAGALSLCEAHSSFENYSPIGLSEHQTVLFQLREITHLAWILPTHGSTWKQPKSSKLRQL